MSKVTGVPMVKLAVRIASREARRKWVGNGLLAPPRLVAVKAPASRRPSSVRGPVGRAGMQSTGRSSACTPIRELALAKAMQGAALIRLRRA